MDPEELIQATLATDPGPPFFHFDPSNPLHYGVKNTSTSDYCHYITYNFTVPNLVAQGCNYKGGLIYTTRIIASRDPNFYEDANYSPDDTLAVFYPWQETKAKVDEAIGALKDIGIEANVAHLR